MAAEDIHVRLCLQEIVKVDSEVKAFIQDIRECATSSSILDRLNSQVKERLGQLPSKLDDLERIGIEQDKETDKTAILKDVENHRHRLSNTVTTLRQANLSAHMAITKREKEELLTSGSDLRQRVVNNKQTLVNAAGGVTESLMSLNRMMAGQVEVGQHTMNTLVSSSGNIVDTHEEFKNMSGHIHSSKKLMTKYNRREFTDKLLIFLALVFFFSTVLYIVKQRVWS